MSLSIASLYTAAADALEKGDDTAAADALEKGDDTAATATLTQIGDDLAVSDPDFSDGAFDVRDRIVDGVFTARDRQEAISDCRSCANDFAEVTS